MRSPWLTVIVLSLVGCTQAFQQDYGIADTNPSSVDVFVPGAPPEAQQRVQAAAATGGWVVTNAAPGVVTVGPYRLRADAQVAVTLHVNIVAADSAGTTRSRAIVTGTRTDAFAQALGRSLAGAQGAASSEGEVVRAAVKGRGAWSWREVTQFAAAIRGDSTARSGGK